MNRDTRNRWLRYSYVMHRCVKRVRHGIHWLAERTWHEWLGGAIFVLGMSAALVAWL